MSAPLDLHSADTTICSRPGVGILIAAGTTKPADASTGYAPGCIFIHEDGASANVVLYVNTGSATSAAFKHVAPITTASALTAADGSTVDTTYGQEEADVIANNVVRIGEIEAALKTIGLLPA